MTAPLASPSPERNALPPAPKWALTGPHATGAEYELLRKELAVGGFDMDGAGAVDADAALEELVADANRGAVATELLDALKTMVASAVPHPIEHPAMTAAWKVARAAIKRAEQHWAPSPVVEAGT